MSNEKGDTMAEAFIVDALRTPVGKRRGGLAEAHPVDLSAHVISHSWPDMTSIRSRSTTSYGDVCNQVGPQTGDIARTAWLASGLPEEVPGVTVDRQCGSGQQAVHFAAQAS